ncbi:uncharacterized protein LOC132550203 [Ylistrum balloti]|uniref:uncharacterized protein LOC132550203 n=1 Tax=Ylistrum balloti TaxID=509963 RepID=UPI002905C1AD|nr:uncharacterized protein LOC132550203 [Ylistrum balloti]
MCKGSKFNTESFWQISALSCKELSQTRIQYHNGLRSGSVSRRRRRSAVTIVMERFDMYGDPDSQKYRAVTRRVLVLGVVCLTLTVVMVAVVTTVLLTAENDSRQPIRAEALLGDSTLSYTDRTGVETLRWSQSTGNLLGSIGSLGDMTSNIVHTNVDHTTSSFIIPQHSRTSSSIVIKSSVISRLSSESSLGSVLPSSPTPSLDFDIKPSRSQPVISTQHITDVPQSSIFSDSLVSFFPSEVSASVTMETSLTMSSGHFISPSSSFDTFDMSLMPLSTFELTNNENQPSNVQLASSFFPGDFMTSFSRLENLSLVKTTQESTKHLQSLVSQLDMSSEFSLSSITSENWTGVSSTSEGHSTSPPLSPILQTSSEYAWSSPTGILSPSVEENIKVTTADVSHSKVYVSFSLSSFVLGPSQTSNSSPSSSFTQYPVSTTLVPTSESLHLSMPKISYLSTSEQSSSTFDPITVTPSTLKSTYHFSTVVPTLVSRSLLSSRDNENENQSATLSSAYHTLLVKETTPMYSSESAGSTATTTVVATATTSIKAISTATTVSLASATTIITAVPIATAATVATTNATAMFQLATTTSAAPAATFQPATSTSAAHAATFKPATTASVAPTVTFQPATTSSAASTATFQPATTSSAAPTATFKLATSTGTTSIITSPTAVITTTVSGIRCPTGQAPCDDGTCVPASRFCDGVVHCPDASDESKDCSCGSGQFKCSSGQCVSSSARCDRYLQCKDKTDEFNCSGCFGFQCASGLCLWSHSSRCNQVFDCEDLSDELGCPFRPGYKRCDNGVFIQASDWCDGVDDCYDNSDETQCACEPQTEIACQDGGCIRQEWACDGFWDCINGTDEKNCDHCSSEEFKCSDYQCVAMDTVCDGHQDCSRGEDELNCFSLSTGNQSDQNLTSGQLLVWHSNHIQPLCNTNWTQQLSDHMCLHLGHEKSIQTVYTPETSSSQNSYFEIKSDITMSEIPHILGNIVNVTSCSSGSLVNISCSKKECGMRNGDFLTAYIAGGELSPLGKWPWVVSLTYLGEPLCAAAILTNQWLVTAGHCVALPGAHDYTRTPFYVQASAGSVKRSRDQTSRSNMVTADRILQHPNFTFTGLGSILWDVALVHLERPLIFTEVIQPICLPTDEDGYDNCYLAGWGYLDNDRGQLPQYLREVKVQVLEDENCSQDTVAMETVVDTNITLCAGYSSGVLSGCQGDSGGPLMCEDTRGHWFLAGVLSSGSSKCGVVTSQTDRYTRVSALREWISDITGTFYTKRTS